MKKRLTLALLAILCAAVVMSSCSDASDGSTDAETTADTLSDDTSDSEEDGYVYGDV